jgi:hypothetical protein
LKVLKIPFSNFDAHRPFPLYITALEICYEITYALNLSSASLILQVLRRGLDRSYWRTPSFNTDTGTCISKFPLIFIELSAKYEA